MTKIYLYTINGRHWESFNSIQTLFLKIYFQPGFSNLGRPKLHFVLILVSLNAAKATRFNSTNNLLLAKN